jgi:hypothetical protein
VEYNRQVSSTPKKRDSILFFNCYLSTLEAHQNREPLAMTGDEQNAALIADLLERLKNLESQVGLAVRDIDHRTKGLGLIVESDSELQSVYGSIVRRLCAELECLTASVKNVSELAYYLAPLRERFSGNPMQEDQGPAELHVSVGSRNFFGNVDWRVITMAEFKALPASRRRSLLANGLVRFVDSDCRSVPLAVGLRILRKS